MRLRFSVRDLLWLTLVAAMCIGWWLDRSRLADKLAECNLLLLVETIKVRSGAIIVSGGENWARRRGWLNDFERGSEIARDLLSLQPNELDKLDLDVYRDQQVAFAGGGPAPGSANDILTADGIYLRVITPSGKPLSKSVWWEILIRGKVLHVLPKNKIIVIEVEEGDWEIGDTG